MMVGMGDGTIRIHKKLDGQGLQMGAPYTLPAHSRGSVNGIMTSFDTRFVLILLYSSVILSCSHIAIAISFKKLSYLDERF